MLFDCKMQQIALRFQTQCAPRDVTSEEGGSDRACNDRTVRSWEPTRLNMEAEHCTVTITHGNIFRKNNKEDHLSLA